MGPTDGSPNYECKFLSLFHFNGPSCLAQNDSSSTLDVDTSLTFAITQDSKNFLLSDIETDPPNCQLISATCDTWDVVKFNPIIKTVAPTFEKIPGYHAHELSYTATVVVDTKSKQLGIPYSNWDGVREIDFNFPSGGSNEFLVDYASRPTSSISSVYTSKFTRTSSATPTLLASPVKTIDSSGALGFPLQAILGCGCIENEPTGKPFGLSVVQTLMESETIKLVFKFRDGSMNAQQYQWKYSSSSLISISEQVLAAISRSSEEHLCAQVMDGEHSNLNSLTGDDARPGTTYTFDVRTKNFMTPKTSTPSLGSLAS